MINKLICFLFGHEWQMYAKRDFYSNEIIGISNINCNEIDVEIKCKRCGRFK